MISSRLAAALQARGVHYGWVVVGVTFLVMLATAGAMGASGVILEPLQREFGWANADISFALAVRLLLFGLTGPFAAAFINRFGVRAVVAFAVALITLGILGTMAMREVWHLLLFWGVVVGLGTGMTALVLGATVATRWFSARRGLAVGLLTASNATGQLVFLPLLAAVTQQWGWRAALALVVACWRRRSRFALALLRDRPSDVGLAPFGERAIVPAPAKAAKIKALLASPLVALREAAAAGCSGSRHDLLRLRALAPTASSRRTGSRCAAITASGRSGPPASWRSSAPSISSARYSRDGSPIATTTAGCCSSITACAGCR